MIEAILIDEKESTLRALEAKIIRFCPEVNIRGKAGSISEAHKLVLEKKPNLLFVDLNMPACNGVEVLRTITPLDCEFIVITEIKEFAFEAIKCCASGYVLKPVGEEELLYAVRNAQKRITLREEVYRNQKLISEIMSQFPVNDLIGVPTMEGLDFISAKDIIRCEGMQKCTRIITSLKSNIVSSYNLGEYRGLLEPYGFFSPHKSHLINLRCIKKYKREGTIIMADDSAIPVSKRKKNDFMSIVAHL